MRKPIATVENLKLDYGSVQAVKDVSFTLYAGEILAIIGPNGSGKTSTVECLEGLRRPSGGRLELLGCQPCENRKQIYRQVGIQLQEADYPDNIKVRELCLLFSSFYDKPADWRLLLRQFGLEGKAGRTVRKLSGGEKQRLSILLALLPKPKLLILDELTTGLDPEVRHGMWESLQQIRNLGTSILLVSHYMDEVEYLADRLAYFAEGRSVFVGTQEEFRAFARSKAPEGQWNDAMRLEDIFLLLTPKNNALSWEGIL